MLIDWMLYATLVALVFSLAALRVERILLRGRSAVRGVWCAAIVLSIVAPIAALTLGAGNLQGVVALPNATAIEPNVGAAAVTTPAIAVINETWNSEFAARWRASAPQLTTPLMIVWLALSLAGIVNMIGGSVALARLRRGWRAQTVLQRSVLISSNVGPAVVGMISPAIVVPEWTLTLSSQPLSLLLLHEHEHRRMHDGQLLTLAGIAAVLMPWNVALLWQLRRLRVAVELDCDARVLRSAEPRAYGELLLNVAREGHGARLIGATAFTERATQLERRIRALARHRKSTSRTARTVACGIGVAVLTGAWIAPHPTPLRRATRAATRSESRPLDRDPIVPKPTTTDEHALSTPSVGTTHARSARTLPNTGVFVRDSSRDTVPTAQRPLTQDEFIQLIRSIAQARNASLRALLSTDEDRALFDSQTALLPGPRSGGGGSPRDTSATAQRAAGARVAGVGDAGNRGAPVSRGSSDTRPRSANVDLQLERLFGSISLTSQQSETARQILMQTSALILDAQARLRTAGSPQ